MKEFLKDSIVGTWKFISWTYIDENGNTGDFFGTESQGILMYDASGYMNAQLMKMPRKAINAAGLFTGSTEEMADQYKTYAAYYGKYYEKRPGEFIHVVEGSLFHNWVGLEEVRYAKIEGDFLTLSTPPLSKDGHQITFYVRWRRVG
jgi:hypothetical protein